MFAFPQLFGAISISNSMDWQNFASITATELQADRSFQQRINLAHGPVENLRNAMLYFMGTDALRTRSELAKLRECLFIVQTMLQSIEIAHIFTTPFDGDFVA